MICHICLNNTAQTGHKGSLYCIKCLWKKYPELHKTQNEIVKSDREDRDAKTQKKIS